MANVEVTRDLKQGVTSEEQTRPERSYRPNVDILETADGLRLWADMPGVDESGIDVELVDDVLTIRGRVCTAAYEGLRPAYTEYSVGNYEASFRLSHAIDSARIAAKLANGVLDVSLPKAETAKPRRIQVN